eukprot:4446697-Amphidinium_carterae.1
MPGLVTILCHAKCLGAWTSFWAPCRGMWSFDSRFETDFKSRTEGKATYEVTSVFGSELVSRTDVCGWRWHMNGKECMETTLEHLMWLLYPKFVHYTFTVTAFRIVKGRIAGNGHSMTLTDAHVLLKFLWLVVTLFGPCLPVLHALIALIAHIYSILLFGTNTQFLYVKETKTPALVAGLPAFGFSTVAFLVLAGQSSNLL